MSDFDVGDLLGDASSKNKSKSKDKSDDKKKKKSKDKEKSKSSSSKKKSKSKSKKSAFEDDFDNDDGGDAAGDWTSSAKNWDSAAELEMAAAVAARRKNGSGKLGGGLDDEFSKMLGLDSGDLGSGANFGNVDIASAKDSLLMDLLGDLSPPKPREPLLSRRRSRSSNDNSPEKQQTQAEDPFKSSLPPSPVQSQPLPTVLELPVETPAVSANGNLEENYSSAKQISQQLEERAAANTQLSQQLATAEHDKLQADQLAATSKNDAAGYQHRAEWLEAELRGLREELSRSKRAVQDAELALARKTAEQDEVDQLERHREKRALEALSAQMQRALARLTVTHQVQEEGSGYDNSAARVAAEDEARLRVIASLEGSSKRAAQHAEQERTKLTELLRELEAGARSARQGALEDKERLRQEQQRLDALSAHLQAQSAVLRDQEAGHAAYMGQQLAEAREDARVYEARLATRRTQLERDERALYEARAEFAAFREQTALEIEREHEELRASRLALEDAWRELRADREDLEAELASHEGEFQALESVRNEVQEAEARLAERTQEVVALAEKLDAGTRDLLAREQIVAEQAAVVQDTDSSMVNRERTLERVKGELEAREQRLHVQIRQLDNARGRLTQQRREQQQLTAVTRRHYSTTEKPAVVEVDNNKHWRHSELASPWEVDLPIEEDPSGLPPALRKQVEANWQRRNQQPKLRVNL
uniref:Uncharacterized protein n=1 Tax=Phytophthora ramorum TaxID=164328 RepID=H3HBM1_PHYRM